MVCIYAVYSVIILILFGLESSRQKQRVASTHLSSIWCNDLISYLLENYWRSTENQRKFFIEFATQKGFDPLVPENWDKMPIEDILTQVEQNIMK